MIRLCLILSMNMNGWLSEPLATIKFSCFVFSNVKTKSFMLTNETTTTTKQNLSIYVCVCVL